MKFNITKEVLLDNLQKVLGPTTTKQNFPILNSILISSTDKKLKFTATDLDTTIIVHQEADIKEKGKIAVPMKRFISIIRELPPNEITVELTKNTLWIKCEKIDFKINTLNPEEFPRVEEDKKVSLIKINAHDLEEMIGLTAFCVGFEDTNYVLNGILFEIQENKINLVATDGKRLAFVQRNLPASQPEIKTKISFILPVRAIMELAKLIKDSTDEIFMYVDESKVGFDLKNTEFIARTIEGEFPMYNQYIPKENKEKLVVDRNQFLFSLRRADLLSTTDYQGVRLELKKDSILISKNTPQLGEAKETLEVEYNGPAIQIGFNPQYIMDVLKNLTDGKVSWEFFGADKPAVLRKEGFVYLVLPMKI